MQEKVLGYFFLFLGIGIIFFAALRVYVVYTTKAEPIQLIDAQSNLGFNLSVPSGIAGQNITVPVQMGQLQPMITVINNFVYLIFMGFFASIGFKIAMLGVNLVRPIVIKAKPEAKNV